LVTSLMAQRVAAARVLRMLGDVVDRERGLAHAVTAYLTSRETTWLRAASRGSATAFVRHCPVHCSVDEVYIETRRNYLDSENYRVPGRNAASPLHCWKLVVPLDLNHPGVVKLTNMRPCVYLSPRVSER